MLPGAEPAQLACRGSGVRRHGLGPRIALSGDNSEGGKGAFVLRGTSGGSRHGDHLDENPDRAGRPCLRRLGSPHSDGDACILRRPLGAATLVSCPHSHEIEGYHDGAQRPGRTARAFLVMGRTPFPAGVAANAQNTRKRCASLFYLGRRPARLTTPEKVSISARSILLCSRRRVVAAFLPRRPTARLRQGPLAGEFVVAARRRVSIIRQIGRGCCMTGCGRARVETHLVDWFVVVDRGANSVCCEVAT